MHQSNSHKQESLQDATTPIAIVGMAFQFPDDAEDVRSFMSMLMQARCASRDFPKDRLNGDVLYHPDASRGDSIPLRGGHFLNQSLGAFDAPFFSISASEAEAMDPQSRALLETSYRALENAGIPIETVSGSNTSVYTGNLGDDYKFFSAQDIEQNSRYGMVGMTGLLSGRLSWFFNLKGPCLTVDTACSSSLVSLDLGCQSLSTGSANMSIVTGCSLLFSPNFFHLLSNMGMLSHDSKSYSFDHRANGYGRGEGIAALILKRLPDAIRDGDTIRAVIRSTATNQDGRTPGVTQPNPSSQAMLIRQAYARAGLDMWPTRYFEAHGTGTPVGDPIEASAIGSVFDKIRTPSDRLYIGCVKSNIGHAEGASGLASVIKSVLILENAMIPPNANFERLNPKIEAMDLPIMVPSVPTPWPTHGLRRISVNSFGASGTNAHAVLDDAYHYLHDRGLSGNHFTVVEPPPSAKTPSQHDDLVAHVDTSSCQLLQDHIDEALDFPRVLLFSAFDKPALQKMVENFDQWARAELQQQTDFSKFMDELSHTLAHRRSLLSNRCFTVIENQSSLWDLRSGMSPATRASGKPSIGFVFTGQGAQWFGMARELMRIPSFYSTVREADIFLKGLGSDWSLRDALWGGVDRSAIDRPLLSQTLCTVIQVAVCDLYKRLGIRPSAVVGHSSGEIAAAYCAGAISRASAFKLAYYRGIIAEEVRKSSTGGMMAVSMSEKNAEIIIMETSQGRPRLTVACINSPNSVTISGDSKQLESLAVTLEDRNIFHRRLKVDVAYHSMELKGGSLMYKQYVGRLEPGDRDLTSPSMVSSVTGAFVDHDIICNVDYWVQNMIQPVRFSDAISNLIGAERALPINFLLEVGPHSTLQGPIKDTLKSQPGNISAAYCSAMMRFKPADKSFLASLGSLWNHGVNIDWELFNAISRTTANKPRALIDLPGYPFDHSCTFWPKGRLGREFRSRRHMKLDLLGKPVLDWNPLEPRWSNFIKLSELPWAADHKINGAVIYPAVGMLVMAIEAANQLADRSRPLLGIKLSETFFSTALMIPTTPGGIETQLILRPADGDGSRSSASWNFRLHSCKDDQWQEHCHGKVQLVYNTAETESESVLNSDIQVSLAREAFSEVSKGAICHKSREEFYASAFKSGYTFGPSFKVMDDISYSIANDKPQAIATVAPFVWEAVDSKNHYQPHIVHPTTLDGVLQISLAAFSRAGLDVVSTAVPTEIEYLWLSASGLSYPHASNIKTRGTFVNKGFVGYETSVLALDDRFENIVLEAKGIKLRFVTGGSPIEQQSSQTNVCYTPSWRPDVDLCEDIEKDAADSLKSHSAGIPLLRHYLDLQAFKTPDMNVIHLKQSDSAAVSLNIEQYFESRELSDVPFSCGNFVTASISNDEVLNKGYTLPLPDESYHLIILSGFPSIIANNILSTLYDRLVVNGKIIVVADAHTHATNNLSLEDIKDSAMPLILRSDSQLQDETAFLASSKTTTEAWVKLLGDAKFVNSNVHADNTGLAFITSRKSFSPVVPHGVKSNYIVVYQDSPVQTELAKILKDSLSQTDSPVETYQLGSAEPILEGSDSVFIFLPELEHSYLQNIPSEEFRRLQRTITTSKGLLWVTAHDEEGLLPPSHAMIDGLSRVLRAETENKVIVTLSLSLTSIQDLSKDILKVVRATDFTSTRQEYEPSYFRRNGLLSIERIMPSIETSQELLRKVTPYQAETKAIDCAPPLRLAVETPGLLDSLYFEEDELAAQALGPLDVEVKVSHIGLNFKDLLLALGRENGKTFGNECAGIVSRVGSSTKLKPGDRVCAFSPTAFSTYTRLVEDSVARVPDQISLAHAAAVPTQFVTAWHSLRNVANLQRGETLLVHSGAGGTGQAAIQIGQLIGAEIFVTVGTENKRRFLIENYGIANDHIFSSRNTSFAARISQYTNGRGIDVILNSLSGESLLASWNLIAPYGRFIELGKKDILASNSLPMRPFIRRATFSAIETGVWASEHSSQGRDMIEHLLSMMVDGKLQAVKSLQILPISKLQEGLRMIQSGNIAGKIVFEMAGDAMVPTRLRTKSTNAFGSNKTYVIAGASGGLGRAIAEWMVKQRGVRYLLLLSRSGAQNPACAETIRQLRQAGTTVEAPECDICDKQAIQEVLQRYNYLPPIAGCIQSSMVLRDGLFANMSHDDWRASTDPKTIGSWNLHSLLPAGLDFFVMLSSISGIVGSAGQSNYAAGNTYMDGLAHFRQKLGERATALDLGVMVDHGVLAENHTLRDRILGRGFLAGVTSVEVFNLLDICCNRGEKLDSHTAQIALGIASPSQIRARAAGQTHPFLSLPPYRHISSQSGRTDAGEDDAGEGNSQEHWRQQFVAASTTTAAGAIISKALLKRLIIMNPDLEDRVDMDALDEPIQRFGVDSLVAVELRSWFSKEFAADVPIFEILGESTLESIGLLAAKRSELK
ncbi:hypothetical protein GQ44DRAFT_673662 [Phaeosphaeriaceae sp. PMI808]|nr:hypothetical protein GQ44DRAFT_673662 [Phaeosphaeriaceae sp. PMI808]